MIPNAEELDIFRGFLEPCQTNDLPGGGNGRECKGLPAFCCVSGVGEGCSAELQPMIIPPAVIK